MTGGTQGGGGEPGPTKPQVNLKKADLANKQFVGNFISNTSSDLILITEDKIRICLMHNFDLLKNRDAWLAPFGIFVTLLTVMLTAEPRPELGLSKDTWKGIGWFCTIAIAIWLFREGWRRITGKHVDPDTIVKELKTITMTETESGE